MATKPKVKIYSTPTCIWCNRTKEFLKENKIPFASIDVGKSRKNAQEMFKISGQMGTPVIDINGKIIVGFDEDALRKELRIK